MERQEMIDLVEEFMNLMLSGKGLNKSRLEEMLHDEFSVQTDFDLHANQSESEMHLAMKSTKGSLIQRWTQPKSPIVPSNIWDSKVDYVGGHHLICSYKFSKSEINQFN